MKILPIRSAIIASISKISPFPSREPKEAKPTTGEKIKVDKAGITLKEKDEP